MKHILVSPTVKSAVVKMQMVIHCISYVASCSKQEHLREALAHCMHSTQRIIEHGYEIQSRINTRFSPMKNDAQPGTRKYDERPKKKKKTGSLLMKNAHYQWGGGVLSRCNEILSRCGTVQNKQSHPYAACTVP